MHYAVDKEDPSFEVVKILCDYHPTGPLVKDFDGKMAMHWLIDRNTPINLDVLRHLVKIHPIAAVTDAIDRKFSGGDVIETSWCPIERALNLKHFKSARIMLHGLSSTIRKIRNLKGAFSNLNWKDRRILIMSINRCSISPNPLVVGKRKRVNYSFLRNLFMRLYLNHFYDLWRVVVSFI